MASHKTKEPEFVYFIVCETENGSSFKGPYAGKRPVEKGYKLVKYRIIREEKL